MWIVWLADHSYEMSSLTFSENIQNSRIIFYLFNLEKRGLITKQDSSGIWFSFNVKPCFLWKKKEKNIYISECHLWLFKG